MTVSEFLDLARAEGIRSDAYDLNGGRESEQYVISKEGVTWSVFYSERGKRVDEISFSSQSDALDWLWKIVSSDPQTRSK